MFNQNNKIVDKILERIWCKEHSVDMSILIM